LIPRIPRIVFLASSIATSAASSQLLFDVPTISTILATLVVAVWPRSSSSFLPPYEDDVSFLPVSSSSSSRLEVIIRKKSTNISDKYSYSNWWIENALSESRD
jgi:hypothetical protein